jgi:hypothetical protein
MKDAQDEDEIPCNHVSRDVRGALDDQFAGSLDATGATYLRKLSQSGDGVGDSVVDQDCASGAFGVDVVVDSVAVRFRVDKTIPASPGCIAPSGKGVGATLGEAGFNLFCGCAGPPIVEGLLHLGAKPLVVTGFGRGDLFRGRNEDGDWSAVTIDDYL